MHATHKPKSKLKFVTLDKESNMHTLWRRAEFLRYCGVANLMKKAQEIEVIIPVTKSQKKLYSFNSKIFFIDRF